MALIINCSYQAYGTTDKVAQLERQRFPGSDYRMLPEILACRDCHTKTCKDSIGQCCVKDSFVVQELYEVMKLHNEIVFVTPVYMNAPTPKVMAFLSRLSMYNDQNGRDLFEGTKTYITAVADVSGTQQTISILTSALQLLGFEFPSKGNREHVLEWKTGKVRGGKSSDIKLYLEDRPDGGNE